MEALLFAATAAQMAQRLYEVASSIYEAMPKPQEIIIEVTSAEGKTTSKETITPRKIIDFSSLKTSILDTVAYHTHTIALFTYSDVKTVLLPWALFGIGHALSAPYFGLSFTPSTLLTLTRLPRTLLWVYLNLLPFTISNQRQISAILEDTVNKPWRPLPSQRLTPSTARNVMIAAYLVAYLFSFYFGGSSQCIALAVLGYLYNDCGGSDNSWIARNLLNGLGFISFGSGAMEVALGRSVAYTPILLQWLRMVALVVFTGVQMADMYDQEGDALAERKTLPLVIGDKACRYLTALSVLAWSFFCPYFWSLGFAGYILPVCTGAYVIKRTLTKKNVVDDKKTYMLWNLWLVTIYCLPLAKVIGAAIVA